MPKRRDEAKSTAKRKKLDNKIGKKDEHPLFNHVVLERIFLHLSVQELMQIRLVCKFWHTTSLTKWRSRATVTLGPRSWSITRTSNFWPVNQFFSSFEDATDFLQLAEKPFKRITLKSIAFHHFPLFDTINVPDNRFNFWNAIGPLLTHLHFHSCTFHGDSRTVFENILKEKLPNLEMLQLTGNDASKVTGKRALTNLNEDDRKTEARSKKKLCNLKTLKIIGDVPMCPAILLLNSPKIETLQTGGDWNFDLVHIVNEVKLQLDGKPFQLKNLDMMESLTLGRFWNTGRQQKCPLEQLSFNVRITSLEDEENVIHPFVSFYANTLQVLKILRPPVCEVRGQCPFSFDMPALRELYLFGNIVRTFRFLSGMPNLEVLYVDNHCFEKATLMEKLLPSDIGIPKYIPFLRRVYLNSSDFPNRRLKKMKILHLNADIRDVHLIYFAECVPNLKVLRTVLPSLGLVLFCREFPKLEELVIFSRGELCVDQSYSNAIFSWGNQKSAGMVMKKLKRFEVHALCDSTLDDRINDLWVFLFLLRIPNLEHVYVSAMMTRYAEESLRRHAGNVTIIRGRQGYVEHDAKCKLCPLTNAKRRYPLKITANANSV